MTDFDRLSRNWIEWATLASMSSVSVSRDCRDCQILFKSDDESFHLRQAADWWTLDEVDDRGKRYDGTVKFSTFELAENYLIWTWASAARSAIGAPQLGVRLQKLGMAPGVEVTPTQRDYFVELRATAGSIILPLSSATVVSHLLSKSADEVENMVKQGII